MIHQVTQATEVVEQPNPVREAGNKLRLIVEEALQRSENDPSALAVVGLCLLADLIDAEISGHDAQWGYSGDTARAMIERLRQNGMDAGLRKMYGDLEYGKIPPNVNELVTIMRDSLNAVILTLLEAKVCALSMPAKKLKETRLITDAVRAINEHRKLRNGSEFVEDYVLNLL